MFRDITCDQCGKVIGRCPVFSHAHDELDAGDPVFNTDYGGKLDGEHYCTGCYGGIYEEAERTVPVRKRKPNNASSPLRGGFRGWGPVTKSIDNDVWR
jgi:hypothetical protein